MYFIFQFLNEARSPYNLYTPSVVNAALFMLEDQYFGKRKQNNINSLNILAAQINLIMAYSNILVQQIYLRSLYISLGENVDNNIYLIKFIFIWGVQNHIGLTHQNFIFDIMVVFYLNLDHLFGGKVV